MSGQASARYRYTAVHRSADHEGADPHTTQGDFRMRRSILAGLSAGLGSLIAPSIARAQSAPLFPTKTVRFIVGLGPGSGADTGTRVVAERLGKISGQPAVVENRTGADQIIAVQTLLAAPPDGHTIMYISPSPVVLTPLLREVPYDPQRDIRPVVFISRGYAVIVTGPNSRFRTFQDLVTEARAKPGMLKMSNYGHHYRIGGLSLQRATGTEFIHVPYKGAAQANNDVIAGDIDVAITDIGGAVPLIEAGRLRPLAVTSPSRHPLLPAVPGTKELGLNYDLQVWTGFAVHGKTPEPIARKVEETLLGILKSPEYAAYNEKQSGGELVAGSGEQLRALIASETARYREMARTMKLAD
jgi:tripartite-type tricarboxylate transporter receptor subunit TctC